MAADHTTLQVDIAIFGGGIAGLWILAKLRKLGYNAILLEVDTLGAGQTHYAQGIIHGGTKYALTGSMGASANAVTNMPEVWRTCLLGKGELDLHEVKLLSPYQYLWSTQQLSSRIAGFFASHLMRSRTQPLTGNERPAVFQNPRFNGQVYRLEEPVLDTASLVKALAKPHELAIWSIAGPQSVSFTQHASGLMPSIGLHNKEGHSVQQLSAKQIIFAAGKGNQSLLNNLGRTTPTMQLRPVHMVMLRGPLPTDVYAHCIGMTDKPRITITSHTDRQGQPVWYLGGQLAEDGVQLDSREQIAAAQHELRTLVPWLEFNQMQWASLLVDRAEPYQPSGKRPDNAFAEEQNGIITVWPTKLALAPHLAQLVVNLLAKNGIEPGALESLPDWPFPGYAQLPWQEESAWN